MDDKKHTVKESPVDTVILSRGGYRDEDDYAESRKRSEIVRGDFLSTTFKAKVTFAYESVTFNMLCVKVFPDNQYVSLTVDQPNQRVVVELCEAGETISLKFANKKDGQNVPRKCMARHFCEMLYEMMGWNTQAKYRALAIEQTFFGKKIIVFNLDECLQVFTEMFTEEDGKKKRKTVINMPGEWKGRFGYTPEELAEKQRKVEKAAEFIRIDNKTGERRGVFIEPKLPTPEELMHQPYGGLRPRKEEGNDDE
jgi:hypothetical protein